MEELLINYETDEETTKSSLRHKADHAKKGRSTTFLCVLENPANLGNVLSVVRNVDAIGIKCLYVVDGRNVLPKHWSTMRNKRDFLKVSASAIKWTYVKTFQTTKECFEYLEQDNYKSVVTSPHILGKENHNLADISRHALYSSPKLAVWFGNETHGISDEAITRSEACLQIEMSGIIESLNLSVSTGIVLYNIRQYRLTKKKQK